MQVAFTDLTSHNRRVLKMKRAGALYIHLVRVNFAYVDGTNSAAAALNSSKGEWEKRKLPSWGSLSKRSPFSVSKKPFPYGLYLYAIYILYCAPSGSFLFLYSYFSCNETLDLFLPQNIRRTTSYVILITQDWHFSKRTDCFSKQAEQPQVYHYQTV